MSYQLAFFDPEIAPREHEQFVRWVEEERGQKELEAADLCSPALQDCLRQFSKVFYELNAGRGRDSEGVSALAEERWADYRLRPTLVEVWTGWGAGAEVAYDWLKTCCARSSCGFFDISSATSAAWFPVGSNRLELVHAEAGGLLRRVFGRLVGDGHIGRQFQVSPSVLTRLVCYDVAGNGKNVEIERPNAEALSGILAPLAGPGPAGFGIEVTGERERLTVSVNVLPDSESIWSSWEYESFGKIWESVGAPVAPVAPVDPAYEGLEGVELPLGELKRHLAEFLEGRTGWHHGLVLREV